MLEIAPKVGSNPKHQYPQKSVKTNLSAISVIALLCGPALSATLNLSSWNALTLDFPGAQPAGNWVLSDGDTTVTQTVNADPSFYLNGLNQTQYSIDGSWQVTTGSDDDFMGFVFGYQNSSNFYLFDWKQATQNNQYGADASEGMTIKKYTGSTGNGLVDLSLGAFWENVGDYTTGQTTDYSSVMTVLDTNHSPTAGWADNTLYNFHLDFNTTLGQFNIIVKQGATELWNTTVTDSTFTDGEFGFYNYSQERVEYRGFEQTGGVPGGGNVPDSGGTALMLAVALGGLGLLKKH